MDINARPLPQDRTISIAMARKGKGKMHGTVIPKRTPSGQLSRAGLAAVHPIAPAEAKRLRDAAVAGMRDPMWGTELGRLFLAGEIDERQFEAGRRWGKLVAGYRKAIGARAPYPRALSFERDPPGHHEEPDHERGSEEWDRARRAAHDVAEDMRESHAALVTAGMLAERAVRSTCEENEGAVGFTGLRWLKLGLNRLAEHWGLTKARTSVSAGKVK